MHRVPIAALCLLGWTAVAGAQPEKDPEVPSMGKPSSGDEAAHEKAQEKAKPATPAREGGGEEVRGNLSLTEGHAGEGQYKGVAPGGPALPPHPPRLPVKKGPQRMTWPGFQLKDGVPTVFLEVTAPPDYAVQDAPGEVTVTLKNTTVPLKNNRRPLDVSGFQTSVTSVAAAKSGKDVRVTIKTKGSERPQHKERVESAAGGFSLVVIELPK
jgi:hypothetical protein